jgi:hypothetical protein
MDRPAGRRYRARDATTVWKFAMDIGEIEQG